MIQTILIHFQYLNQAVTSRKKEKMETKRELL